MGDRLTGSCSLSSAPAWNRWILQRRLFQKLEEDWTLARDVEPKCSNDPPSGNCFNHMITRYYYSRLATLEYALQTIKFAVFIILVLYVCTGPES